MHQAWLRSKLPYRIRRQASWTALRARQLASYVPPGEQRVCPACGAQPTTNLEPLSITSPASVRWKFGFISGCEQCGVVFANPMPSEQELDTVYSPEGEWGRHRQDEQEKAVSARRLAWLFNPLIHEFDVLRPSAGATVLDFGCGLGGMLDALEDVGWTTYGIEPATDVAFRRHRRLTEIPDDARFDLVLLSHVLEHVTAPLGILRQLARATRPGGLLLVRLPNLEGVGEHRDLKYCIRSKTHLMAYSVPCLEWLLADAGFALLRDTVRTEHNARHLIVLARRVAEPVSKPVQPLTAARRALRAYAAGSHGDQHRWRPLPVRLRAAMLNMARGGRSARAGTQPATPEP
jgi:2-polyprenyl-3-methyl-5-hydroxy-6-metoxy-1,4-benzoquinol methylase